MREDLVKTVQRGCKHIRNRLLDYISEREIQGIENFAFEYACQEAEYTGLDKKNIAPLVHVRTYTFLYRAYEKLYEINNDAPDVIRMTYKCPSTSLIPEFIKLQYSNKRKRLPPPHDINPSS
jgi:hypothetical protein